MVNNQNHLCMCMEIYTVRSRLLLAQSPTGTPRGKQGGGFQSILQMETLRLRKEQGSAQGHTTIERRGYREGVHVPTF